MSDSPQRNANIVEALESALRAGNHALNTAPDLMCRTIDEGCWRHFITKRGEDVSHDSFPDFITAQPLKGLGISIEEARRLIAHDPRALSLFDSALGTAGPAENESIPANQSIGPATAKALNRLLAVDPKLHDEVKSGARSANSALIAAGLRPRVFRVKAGDANATVQALRKHLSAEQLEEVKKLL